MTPVNYQTERGSSPLLLDFVAEGRKVIGQPIFWRQ